MIESMYIIVQAALPPWGLDRFDTRAWKREQLKLTAEYAFNEGLMNRVPSRPYVDLGVGAKIAACCGPSFLFQLKPCYFFAHFD